jgi:hypothetical protein
MGKTTPTGWKRLLVRLRTRWDQHPWEFHGLLLLGVVLAGLPLFPREGGYQPKTYRLGTIQPRAVIAEFDFPINKDPEVLRREQAEAEASVPPVLVMEDSLSQAARASFRRFTRLVSELRRGRYERDEALPPEDPANRLSQRVIVALLGSPSAGSLLRVAQERLDHYLSEGVVDSATAEAIRRYERVSLRTPSGEWVGPPTRFYDAQRIREDVLLSPLPDPNIPREILLEMVQAFAIPNVRLDAEATAARRRLARESVPTSVGMVLKGEKIIGAHERITPEHLRKLESYEYWKRQRQGYRLLGDRIRSWTGHFLLLVLTLVGFGLYVRFNQPHLFQSRRDLATLAHLLGFFLLLAGILVNHLRWPALVAPLAAAGILTSLLYDPRLALALSAFLVACVGLVGDLGLSFMVVMGTGAAAAVGSLRAVRQRREFYRTVLYAAAAQLLVLGAMGLAQTIPGSLLVRQSLWVVINPFLAVGLTLLAVPVAESLSGRCTDMTLLELQDLNRPLMKRLMLEAPGTYHHSLMVGALAEAAAQAVGANPLLARVIAYYHDIGKLSKPDYFIENLAPGQKNPHDRLAPTMSRLILETHVREGVQLAREWGLPEIVLQGIAQHHGRTVMGFFLHRARKADPNVAEEEYRYPGPRPQFPEAAIVLLADQVDAASRTLENPTPSRIRNLVATIVRERALEGELDDSRLTLRDVAAIRDSFVPILAAVFHGRIAYPPVAGIVRGGEAARETKPAAQAAAAKKKEEARPR